MPIDKLIHHIENNFHTHLVSDVVPYGANGRPADVDFYTYEYELRKIANFLTNEGFALSGRKYGLGARKVVGGDLYYLDFSTSLDFSFFPGYSCKEKFYVDLVNDRNIERFFRYILGLRGAKKVNDKKFINFVENNFDIYGKYLSNTVYLNRPLCKKNITKEMVLSAMEGGFWTRSKIFTLKTNLQYTFSKIRLIFLKIFQQRGRIISVIGPDGSGKTTSVSLVADCLGVHRVYLGDRKFKGQRFYDWLWGLGTPFSYGNYFFMYFEQWLRIVIVFFRRFKGDIVITDRWPGFNQNVYGSKKRKGLFSVLYLFFPKPDTFVLLTADSETIYRRKPELSKNEIEESITNLRILVNKYNHVEIMTHDKTESINKLLHYVVYESPSAATIGKALQSQRPVVIELSGYFGSGKSSTAKSLINQLSNQGYCVQDDQCMWDKIKQQNKVRRWIKYMAHPYTWLFLFLSLFQKKVTSKDLPGQRDFKNNFGPIRDVINRDSFLRSVHGVDFVVFDGGSIYHVPELCWRYSVSTRYVDLFLSRATYLRNARAILFNFDLEASHHRTGNRDTQSFFDQGKSDERYNALIEMRKYFEVAYDWVKVSSPFVVFVQPSDSVETRTDKIMDAIKSPYEK